MIDLKRSVILLSLMLCSLLCYAQGKISVSGYVKDASTGEVIVGAVVYTPDKSVGVSTNEFGFYSLTLSSTDSELVCSCIGYVTVTEQVGGAKAELKKDFILKEDNELLDAAKVFSTTKRDILKMPQMGSQTVDAVITKKMPTLMGEPDLIRVIQMMPGVQTPSEGSTGFSVRGGGVDQNLILMDGAPIYNCGHFLGFFSMFNSDAVKNAQLFKGDFPAKYGGKNSSVLDITTVDGNMNRFGGNVSIGLIASKVFLEGPIAKDKASFSFSARRSYVDLFFPIFKLDENTKLSFYDINAKINWKIGENDRIYLAAFNSRDEFGLAMREMTIDQMVFGYRNFIQSARWNHVFSSKVFSNFTLYNSSYRASLGCRMAQSPFDWESDIRETGVRGSFTSYLGNRNTMEFGFVLANVKLRPSETTPGENSVVNDVHAPNTIAFNPAVYIQNETKAGILTLRYGLRYSSFSSYGETDQYYYDPVTHEHTKTVHYAGGTRIKTYHSLEPRASASLSVSDNASLKASYARSTQYIQQAVVSISGSVLDAWFTASPNVKPQLSDQFCIGYNQNFADDAIEFSLEGFYKDNKNTVDLRDNPGLVIDNLEREGLLRFGTSNAYGIESMFKFEFAKINGWLAYTWSRAFYKIDGINNGEPYRSPINHEHTVNAVLTYDITKRLSTSASWVYYSGAPTTYPVSGYFFRGAFVPVYSKRNVESMPDYHRLDLSVTLQSRKRAEGKRWSGEWNLSLYNAYARHNAWAVVTNYDHETGTATASKIYLFTIVPSISYNLKF